MQRVYGCALARQFFIIDTIMRRILAIATVFVLWFSLLRSTVLVASPVLLTFDVEAPTDEDALKKLAPDVPATYFITGEFAQNHKELVAALSKGDNTVGSHSYIHPHFKSLDSKAVLADLTASKKILESITGKPLAWFRSPYLEYDERTMQTLNALGFQGDSSDKEQWSDQALIYELPISGRENGTLIASDYDMLKVFHFSKSSYEATLRKFYQEKASSGQPLVVLIHPSVSVEYPDDLKRFIAYVKKKHGEFFSIDSYCAGLQKPRPRHFAVWADFSDGVGDPESIASGLLGAGATDIFVKVPEPMASCSDGLHDSRELFGKMVAILQSKGVKVHLWLSPLASHTALTQHPEWAMTEKNNDRSALWMSPGNPEVSSSIAKSVKDLIRTYHPDGICLDNLSYPSSEYDYSPQMLEAFAKYNHLDHTPTLSMLMNRYYTEWCNWRSQVISSFAGKIGETVRREGKGSVAFSATISSNSAINYRTAETSGQNFAMFDRNFDFLVPDITVSLKGNTFDVEKLRLTLFAMRAGAGMRPMMLRVNDSPNGTPISAESLAIVSGELSIGVDGLSLFPGLKQINPQLLDRLHQVFLVSMRERESTGQGSKEPQ